MLLRMFCIQYKFLTIVIRGAEYQMHEPRKSFKELCANAPVSFPANRNAPVPEAVNFTCLQYPIGIV